MKLSDMRREYAMDALKRSDLADNPVEQFNLWLEQAIKVELTDPTAMTVATVDEKWSTFPANCIIKKC